MTHSASAALRAAMAICPLVAILRGVRPDEVEAIADGIIEAGFSLIEVPLNSPEPLVSIEKLARRYGEHVVVGAGTVLTVEQVGQVRDAGGTLIVSPNVDTSVIGASAAAGLISLPGYFTPTEAFAALAAGATGLKLFPAEGASPAVLKAQRAVIPATVPMFAVGGVSVENLADWAAGGAHGAGLGSALYKAGLDAATVASNARAFVAAAREAFA